MKRVLKIGAIALSIVAGVAVCAVIYVYVASERVISRTYPVPLAQFQAPHDAASIETGRRLATIYGCNNCHEERLNGHVMYDEPGIARITAPNVSRIAKEYTDAELERLIRRGVKHDGTSTWIMPTPMFSHLTDDDVANIIAYVRSVPEIDGVERELTVRLLGRIGIAMDKFRPHASQVTANAARDPDRTDPLSHGRYLVMSACTECHGGNLEGSDMVKAPGLMIAAAYSKDEFAALMRTGTGVGERKLGLMGEMGRKRFAAFSDAEVDAVWTYLDAFVKQGGTALP